MLYSPQTHSLNAHETAVVSRLVTEKGIPSHFIFDKHSSSIAPTRKRGAG